MSVVKFQRRCYVCRASCNVDSCIRRYVSNRKLVKVRPGGGAVGKGYNFCSPQCLERGVAILTKRKVIKE